MKFRVVNKSFKEKLKVLSDFSFNDGMGNYIKIKSLDEEAIRLDRENNSNACEVEVFATVEEDGDIALPFSELFTVISSTNDAKELLFESNEDYLSISSTDENQKFEYQIKLVQLVSNPIQWSTDQTFKFNPVTFVGMLKTTSVFASTDEARAYLCGIYVENVDNSLRMSATDGRRACRTMLEKYGKDQEDVLPFDSFNIPLKFAKIVIKNMGHLKEDIFISVGKNHLTIKGHKITMHTSLIREKFPNINGFMNASNNFEFSFNTRDLHKAVTRASACKDKTNGVFLELDSNSITVSASNETRSVTESIEAHYTGKKCTISFAFNYLLDLLNTYSNDYATISLNSPNKAVLAEDDKATYVLMPRVAG